MKIAIDRRRFKFYLWVGLVYMFFWLMFDLAKYPGTFIERFFNNIWRTIYIIAINFMFWEYILSFVLRKRKYLLYNILLGLLALWVQMMLCSFGLFVWRLIGVQLHVYTPLRAFKSIEEGVSYGAAFGMFSIFFF